MRYDLKINMDELYAVLQSVRAYRSCLDTISAASGRFLACLERQESQSYAALSQVWNDKILNDEAELMNRLGIMEDILERYISAMQGYIQPCDSSRDIRVDKSDIWWNIEQMKAAERKLQAICMDVGSSYADYHRDVSPLDPNAEAIKAAERDEQQRRENNYNKLQSFRDDIAGAFHAEFEDRMSKIYELYEDHIEPFEETDNRFQKEALDYYDAWASASDHFETAKRVISDVGQATIAAAGDFVESMDTLAMMSDPTRMLMGVLETGGKETVERVLGLEMGIAQTMIDPVGTIEAVGQSATDTLAEEGLAYGAAYVATDTLLGLALDKGLGTLGKGTSGAGKVSDLTGDAASLANKLDDVADTAGDLAHITDKAADATKYADDVVEGAIEGSLKSGLTQDVIDEIVSAPKGSRPAPSTYLTQEYIDAHLAQFDDGASIIMTKEQYIQYVKGNSWIGIPDDGTQFVIPKNYCDEIASMANGDISIYETKLGFDAGHFEDGGGLVRIDIDDLEGLDLRMPSGNECGANSHWIPGGKTDGGVPEAVTDLIPNASDNITVTEID